MPARGRPEWTRQAIECFRSQTYPNKEFIILQDIDEPSIDAKDYPDIRVMTAEARSIPVKRNLLTRVALGEAIANFDSDDWSHPDRLAWQVAQLQECGKAVVGFHSLMFFDAQRQRAYSYRGKEGYACGSTLMFRKDWALSFPYPEWKLTESDNVFVKTANANHQLLTTDGLSMMVARIHSGNTSAKPTSRLPYRTMPLDSLPEGFPR